MTWPHIKLKMIIIGSERSCKSVGGSYLYGRFLAFKCTCANDWIVVARYQSFHVSAATYTAGHSAVYSTLSTFLIPVVIMVSQAVSRRALRPRQQEVAWEAFPLPWPERAAWLEGGARVEAGVADFPSKSPMAPLPRASWPVSGYLFAHNIKNIHNMRTPRESEPVRAHWDASVLARTGADFI